MASLLAEAEQLGLIEVFLVTVTSEGLSALHPQRGQSKADRFYGPSEDQETTVDHWRRLDGSEATLEQETLDLERGDCILQVRSLVGLCAQVVFDFDVLLLEGRCSLQAWQACLNCSSAYHTTRGRQGTSGLCHSADKLLCKVLLACHTHADAGPILLWVQRLPAPHTSRLARDSKHVSSFQKDSAKHESMCLC